MTTLAYTLQQELTRPEAGFISDHERLHFQALRESIPGWSDLRHWVFFRALARVLAEQSSVLVLGVYHGLDIALLRAVGCKGYVVGVDKFSDTPCADWPEHWRDRSWQSIGIGDAPNLERARACLQRVRASDHTLLVESDDAAFLRDCQMQFDCIYLDTAHDRATVERQIRQVRAHGLLKADGLLAGDDYDNLEPTWGVRDAVVASLTHHHVLAHRIWWADAAALRVPAAAPVSA